MEKRFSITTHHVYSHTKWMVLRGPPFGVEDIFFIFYNNKSHLPPNYFVFTEFKLCIIKRKDSIWINESPSVLFKRKKLTSRTRFSEHELGRLTTKKKERIVQNFLVHDFSAPEIFRLWEVGILRDCVLFFHGESVFHAKLLQRKDY